jgi:hypothetical protein
MTHNQGNRFLAAFRRLSTTRGLSLGGLQSGRRFEFIVVTAAATLAFAPARDYTEAEVNALLKDWLAGPGAMVATDHVELRRVLIDCRLIGRDGFGRRYGRRAVPDAWQDAIGALTGVDLAAEADQARAANAAQRAQRKAQWENRTRRDATGH